MTDVREQLLSIEQKYKRFTQQQFIFITALERSREHARDKTEPVSTVTQVIIYSVSKVITLYSITVKDSWSFLKLHCRSVNLLKLLLMCWCGFQATYLTSVKADVLHNNNSIYLFFFLLVFTFSFAQLHATLLNTSINNRFKKKKNLSNSSAYVLISST